MSTNRQENPTFNLNNMGLLSDQLSIMFQGWGRNYSIFKKRKNFIFYSLKKNIKKIVKLTFFFNKVKMFILFGYRKLLPKNIEWSFLNKLFVKKKKIKKCLKFIRKLIKKKNYVNNFYLRFFKKFDVIYKRYMEMQNIEPINYSNFSFLYIHKKKQKKQKTFIRQLNLFYFINKILLQFFIFIFMH